MRRPYLLGLTGSIGMGKTTTARLFAEAGVPVWDADAAVHRLYGPGGAAGVAIASLAPEAAGPQGVDRNALRQAVAADPALLPQIEAAVHPLVAADRAEFLRAEAGAEIAVCDIPLLFETGAEKWLDGVLVVTASAETQRARVLARPGMTEAAYAAILARQMPDAEKRARADFVILTDNGVEAARRDVLSCLEQIKAKLGDA